MKLDFDLIIACIIVVMLITGGGAVLGVVLGAICGIDIKICIIIGIVGLWSFFIIQYNRGNTIINIPKY